MQIFKFAEKHGLKSVTILETLKAAGYENLKPLSKITDEMIAVLDLPEPTEPTPIAVSEPKQPKTFDKQKFYYSESERLTLGGFKPEERGQGFIKPDVSLQFDNHFLITSDEDEQKFIEATKAFTLGRIRIKTSLEYQAHMKNVAERRLQAKTETMQRAGRQ